MSEFLLNPLGNREKKHALFVFESMHLRFFLLAKKFHGYFFETLCSDGRIRHHFQQFRFLRTLWIKNSSISSDLFLQVLLPPFDGIVGFDWKSAKTAVDGPSVRVERHLSPLTPVDSLGVNFFQLSSVMAFSTIKPQDSSLIKVPFLSIFFHFPVFFCAFPSALTEFVSPLTAIFCTLTLKCAYSGTISGGRVFVGERLRISSSIFTRSKGTSWRPPADDFEFPGTWFSFCVIEEELVVIGKEVVRRDDLPEVLELLSESFN